MKSFSIEIRGFKIYLSDGSANDIDEVGINYECKVLRIEKGDHMVEFWLGKKSK